MDCLEENISNNAPALSEHCLLLVSTVLAIYTAYQYFFVDGKVNGVYQNHYRLKIYLAAVFSESISIDMGIILDPFL